MWPRVLQSASVGSHAADQMSTLVMENTSTQNAFPRPTHFWVAVLHRCRLNVGCWRYTRRGGAYTQSSIARPPPGAEGRAVLGRRRDPCVVRHPGAPSQTHRAARVAPHTAITTMQPVSSPAGPLASRRGAAMSARTPSRIQPTFSGPWPWRHGAQLGRPDPLSPTTHCSTGALQPSPNSSHMLTCLHATDHRPGKEATGGGPLPPICSYDIYSAALLLLGFRPLPAPLPPMPSSATPGPPHRVASPAHIPRAQRIIRTAQAAAHGRASRRAKASALLRSWQWCIDAEGSALSALPFLTLFAMTDCDEPRLM
jgi:hypothetical protein